MRILIVGAGGVLGRSTLPHLGAHEVMGTTRTVAKLDLIAALGARPERVDVLALVRDPALRQILGSRYVDRAGARATRDLHRGGRRPRGRDDRPRRARRPRRRRPVRPRPPARGRRVERPPPASTWTPRR